MRAAFESLHGDQVMGFEYDTYRTKLLVTLVGITGRTLPANSTNTVCLLIDSSKKAHYNVYM